MSKRPPLRPRHADRVDVGPPPGFAVGREWSATASPAPAASVEDGAGSRGQLLELLTDLGLQGALSAADEAALLRRYDDMLAELREERGMLEAAFSERLDEDGREQAEAWLRDQAQALGRRQGERMRALVADMPGLAGGDGALPSTG